MPILSCLAIISFNLFQILPSMYHNTSYKKMRLLEEFSMIQTI